MSKRVPTTINNTIKTTKDCIYIGETVSANVENGFIETIMNFPFLNKVFSTVN